MGTLYPDFEAGGYTPIRPYTPPHAQPERELTPVAQAIVESVPPGKVLPLRVVADMTCRHYSEIQRGWVVLVEAGLAETVPFGARHRYRLRRAA